jgi:hypothetical protein
MKKNQLQSFLHKQTSYSRPNQDWECGKQAQGYSCEAGPDTKGCCRTEYECQPHRAEMGWVCTRSNNYGGNCADGPMPNGECCKKIVPCMPIRSIRGKRNLLVKWSAFAVFAILILLLTSGYKADFFSPGELTFKHANIEKCSTCHEVFDKNVFGWIKQALSSNNVIHSSQKCLDCHQFGDNAHDAHGLMTDDLQQIRQRKNEYEGIEGKQLACQGCHLDHHGENSDLTAVAKQNCTYCHLLDQSIINAEHPEFKQYPYKRNTRIIFDHTTHEKKYYYNKAGDKRLETAPESCLSCHHSDDNGIKMQQHSYDEDCKSCHNDMFEEAESFIVFDLPELAFDTAELKVEWPENASGSITGFMAMLLASDKQFVEAVAGLNDYYDLTSLDKQNTLKIIKAIKKLFIEIDSQGANVFKQRMEKALNCQLNAQGQFKSGSLCENNKAELEQLVKLFPVKLFCKASKQWFPSLAKEYKEEVKTGSEHNYCNSVAVNAEEGGWILDELSIEYKPEKHKDEFLQSWLNLSSHKLDPVLAEKARLALFEELSSEDASVQCTKCHSIESADDNSLVINWMAPPVHLRQKAFIKFNHNAHIKYQEETICINCHVENKKSEYLEGYEDQDPVTFQSNFITKRKNCSSCHQQSMVKEQCHVCHNYHVSL